MPAQPLCYAVIGRVRRAIHANGSYYENIDDFLLWYWDNTLITLRRVKQYVYPDTESLREYVGNRVVVDPPGIEISPRGQIVIISGWKNCLHWLAEYAELETICSGPIASAVQTLLSKPANPLKTPV